MRYSFIGGIIGDLNAEYWILKIADQQNYKIVTELILHKHWVNGDHQMPIWIYQ